MVGPCLEDLSARRGVDAVEPQNGKPGRKRAQSRSHRTVRRQRTADRLNPKPVVEVPKHDTSGFIDQVDERPRLCVALVDTQAQMGCDYSHLADRKADAGGDSPARLALLVGNVGYLRFSRERPAAQQHLSV